jgi:hypothetical protein
VAIFFQGLSDDVFEPGWDIRIQTDRSGGMPVKDGIEDYVEELLVNCALKNLPPLKPQMELLEAEKEIVPRLRTLVFLVMSWFLRSAHFDLSSEKLNRI